MLNWASVTLQLGDPVAALAALNEAREIRERGPNDRSLGNIYLQLALVHSRLAEWEPALRYSMHAVETFDRLAEPGDQSRAYRTRAAVLRSLGADERARYYTGRAVDLARRQKDSRHLASALAQSAEIERDVDVALSLHEAAADAYARALEPDLAMREAAAAARLLYENGRSDQAYQRWLSLKAMRSNSRISLQALYLYLGAELLAAREETPAAIAMADDASRLFRKLRNLQGELDAQLLLAGLQTHAGQLGPARVHLDSALELHASRISNLPSPAQVNAAEQQSLRMKDRLIDWYRAVGAAADSGRWIADLANVNRLPQWQAKERYQADWRRYMFNLSRLQDDNLTADAAAELLNLVERDESQLELSFERAPATATSANALQRGLPARSALLGVMRGSHEALALWSSAGETHILDWKGRTGLASTPPSMRALGPDAIVYAWGDAELTGIDLAHDLYPDRAAAELPTVVYLVGDLDHADALRRPTLPSAHTVSGLALSPSVGLGLSGAQREVAWLRKHYRARFLESNASSGTVIQFAAADVLHLAAHGWSYPDRSLASALVAELPGAQTGVSQALSAADFAFSRRPSLIILNACETAGARTGGRPWSMARELARQHKTAVIAPDDLVDDRAALEFSRTLHRALDHHDFLTAYAQAVREYRMQSGRNAQMPWRLLWAGGTESSALVGEPAPTQQMH